MGFGSLGFEVYALRVQFSKVPKGLGSELQSRKTWGFWILKVCAHKLEIPMSHRWTAPKV